MDCSCNVMSLELDEGSYSERYRTAAKDSQCPECGSKIGRGDRYLFTTKFLDGKIHNSKMCLSCESVVNQFFPDGYYTKLIWETLEAYLDNSWLDDLPSSCISKLDPKAKAVVCGIMQRYQEEA